MSNTFARFLPARRNLICAAAAALLLCATPVLPVQDANALKLEGKPKIAFIYAATARDGGWNEALDNARMAVEKELGIKIAVVESIKEEATALKNAIDLFVGRGFNVIVATGYGYSEGVLEAANANPNIAFINASGATNNGKNLEGFYTRTYQAWYLAGMAAAGASKSGKIGIIGGCGELGCQRIRARCSGDQPEDRHDGGLHQLLVGPGQGR